MIARLRITIISIFLVIFSNHKEDLASFEWLKLYYMKQGLLILCLVYSSMSFSQVSQASVSEVNELETQSPATQQNIVTIEKISNEHELDIKKIERPKVSEKKQIPAIEKKEPSNN